MEKVNYQLILDKELLEIKKSGITQTLLLHSCCGPCSTYVLEYLSQYFKIKLLFYNPNIMPKDEYEHRLSEQKRLVNEMPLPNTVEVIDGKYNVNDFIKAVKWLENEPECGKRCEICISMRIQEAAKYAAEFHANYFATTLTISPHKNPIMVNSLGKAAEDECGVKWLCADFKKRDGFKRSIELSEKYNLYRQRFCGCIFSNQNK